MSVFHEISIKLRHFCWEVPENAMPFRPGKPVLSTRRWKPGNTVFYRDFSCFTGFQLSGPENHCRDQKPLSGPENHCRDQYSGNTAVRTRYSGKYCSEDLPDPYHGYPHGSAPYPIPTTPGTHPPRTQYQQLSTSTVSQPGHCSPGFIWIQWPGQNTEKCHFLEIAETPKSVIFWK